MENGQDGGASVLRPIELYEKLNALGDEIRTLKSQKANKVSLARCWTLWWVCCWSVLWFSS